MTGQDLVNLIGARVGNRTGASIQTNSFTEILAAQIRLERGPELPYKLLKLSNTLMTTPSVKTVVAPTDLIRESERGFFILDSAGVPREVRKADYRVLRHEEGEDYLFDQTQSPPYPVTKKPYHYDLLNGTFYFFPIPDKAYTLEFFYFAQDTVLTLLTSNTWSTTYPDLVVAEAMMPIARFLRDTQLMQVAMQDKQTEYARIIADNTAYDEANKDRVMGASV